MGISTAERNRRKRERKKREREERRKAETAAPAVDRTKKEDDVEIEYVVDSLPTLKRENVQKSKDSLPAGLPPMNDDEEKQHQQQAQAEDMDDVLRRFHDRSAVMTAIVTDDELKLGASGDGSQGQGEVDDDYDEEEDDRKPMSKRKLREMIRPTVADLKRRVKRPDLVEAHDITAADPDFLIHLKGVPGTVPVPRHWGRKRKYLQGKRGFEKPPFKLPDFIVKTGITEIRDTVAEDEAGQTAKNKNRSKVNPKMGAMDVDYKTLYEAFFKYQTKPANMTKFGNLYYEGKEMETSTNVKPGGPFTNELRIALGMVADSSPPPWLINMQRYGPPPSYPNLAIPGLNAPLPNDRCQYGYHQGGWGKPPMDQYGRPSYGGNPFDPPGSGKREDDIKTGIVTSDGKTINKSAWGLPVGHFILDEEEESSEEDASSEEESSVDAMEESDDEESEKMNGMESTLPLPPKSASTIPGDLRKTTGDETPIIVQPKQLYQVLQQTSNKEEGGVFQSDVKYMVPGPSSRVVPDGAASVLSKAVEPRITNKQKPKADNDDDDDEDDKNFKF